MEAGMCCGIERVTIIMYVFAFLEMLKSACLIVDNYVCLL